MIAKLRSLVSASQKVRRSRSVAKRHGDRRILFGEPLERRVLLAADLPIITEFLARNNASRNDDTGVRDQFGASSDWIEIFNPTGEPLSLAGWHLTDDADTLDKWTFPEKTIEPGEFMLVFASVGFLRAGKRGERSLVSFLARL